MLRVSVKLGPIRPVVKEVRNWRCADWDMMQRQLVATNWRREFRGKEADRIWGLFKGKVTDAVQKHVPTKRIRNNGRLAWMRGEIMAALKKKKKLWLRARQGCSCEQKEYKVQERVVKNMAKQAKRPFEKKLAEGGNKNKNPSLPM